MKNGYVNSLYILHVYVQYANSLYYMYSMYSIHVGI